MTVRDSKKSSTPFQGDSLSLFLVLFTVNLFYLNTDETKQGFFFNLDGWNGEITVKN